MLPDRKKLPHDVPYWVEDGAIYFITVNCRKRFENQLCLPAIAGSLHESIAFRHQKREWWVRLALLMPDHLHMLVSFSREVAIKESIKNWKRFNARHFKIEWQRDFFEHRIRDNHELQEKESYIRMNPVRKSLCASADEWKYFWKAADLDG